MAVKQAHRRFTDKLYSSAKHLLFEPREGDGLIFTQRAAKMLADWKNIVPKFVKVLPKDYARVLQSLKKVQSQGLSGEDAIMAAFEEIVRDVARVGGG